MLLDVTGDRDRDLDRLWAATRFLSRSPDLERERFVAGRLREGTSEDGTELRESRLLSRSRSLSLPRTFFAPELARFLGGGEIDSELRSLFRLLMGERARLRGGGERESKLLSLFERAGELRRFRGGEGDAL